MIKLYTMPNCPKCNVIKMKLGTKPTISYEVTSDEERMRELNILSVPVLELDDGTLLRDFTEINNYVNSIGNEGEQL